MEILGIHCRDAALAADIDFARLAQLTPGFVGADLEALCREAAMIALRRVLPHIDYERGYIPYETLVNLNITMSDFQAALREIEPSTTREVYVEVSETSWDDIGGLTKAKTTLTEGVEWPIRFPELYESAKIEAPRGVQEQVKLSLLVLSRMNVKQVSLQLKDPSYFQNGLGNQKKAYERSFVEQNRQLHALCFSMKSMLLLLDGASRLMDTQLIAL